MEAKTPKKSPKRGGKKTMAKRNESPDPLNISVQAAMGSGPATSELNSVFKAVALERRGTIGANILQPLSFNGGNGDLGVIDI